VIYVKFTGTKLKNVPIIAATAKHWPTKFTQYQLARADTLSYEIFRLCNF